MSRLPVPIVSVALLLCALPASGQLLRVYYPDIEQGSATLVVSPTGQALLIDAGTGIKSTEDGIEDFINDLLDAGVVASIDFITPSQAAQRRADLGANLFSSESPHQEISMVYRGYRDVALARLGGSQPVSLAHH